MSILSTLRRRLHTWLLPRHLRGHASLTEETIREAAEQARREWLASLKVGDRVTYRRRGALCYGQITQDVNGYWAVDNTNYLFRKSDGKLAGEDVWLERAGEL